MGSAEAAPPCHSDPAVAGEESRSAMSWIGAQGRPGTIEDRTRARFLAALGMTSGQRLFSDQSNGSFVTTLEG
jgi:hypothetical protein